MAVFQTEIETGPASLRAGVGPYANSPDFDKSRIVSPNESATIEPGTFVVRDSADPDWRLVRRPASEADLQDYAEGFVQACSSVPENGYASGDTIVVRETLYSVVTSETQVAYGDPVFIRITAGGAGEVPGNVRNDADGGNAVELADVMFASTSGGAGEPAIVKHHIASAP